MTDAFYWLLGLVLLIFSAWILILNWGVFFQSFVKKKQASSWIPLLGGLSGAAGLIALPSEQLGAYWFLPLFLDWGSIPGLAYSAFARSESGPAS